MANNENINKVVFGNQTLMDLTQDTVTPEDVAEGKTFHDASGALRTGTGGTGTLQLTMVSYGSSTWAEFEDAFLNNRIVYCLASSNATHPEYNPKRRLAFMAYVDSVTNPTEVEFQYYRSVATHTDNTQGDEIFVYKFSKANGWSFLKRNAFSKIAGGTGLSGSYSNGQLTLALSAEVQQAIAGMQTLIGTNLTGILTAGSTSLVLQDESITTNSLYDFYSSVYGVSPTDVVVETGQLTMTFEAQQTNVVVIVRVITPPQS